MGKQQRQTRIRKKVRMVSNRPRLSVYRSNNYIYAQIIDDTAGKTLVSISEKGIDQKGTKQEKAKAVGVRIAQQAKEKNISKVVFDKGRYTYHGRVKALAQGAREGGLEF